MTKFLNTVSGPIIDVNDMIITPVIKNADAASQGEGASSSIDMGQVATGSSINISSPTEIVFISPQLKTSNSYIPTNDKDLVTKDYVDENSGGGTEDPATDTTLGLVKLSDFIGLDSNNQLNPNVHIYDWDGNSSTTTPSNIALFQKIWDDYLAGNRVAVITNKDDKSLLLFVSSLWSTTITLTSDVFTESNMTISDAKTMPTHGFYATNITKSEDTITNVSAVFRSFGGAGYYVLDTNTDYTTPYTPLYDGSPATKKYVDDGLLTKITEPTSEGTSGQVLTTNGSGTRTWTTVSGVGVPTGGTTGQILSKKSNVNNDTEWKDAPNSAVWGGITGVLNNQTDLFNALNNKQDKLDTGSGAIINPYVGSGSLVAKSQLHFHSNKSDGAQTYTETYQAYKDAGYHFLNRTDHNTAEGSSVLSGIISLRGVEQSTDESSHVGVIDLASSNDVWNLQSGYTGAKPMEDIVDYYKNTLGKVVIANHPMRVGYEFTVAQIRDYGFHAIEIYNGKYDENYEAFWDTLLMQDVKVWGISADDCHDVTNSTQFNRGWINVFTDNLNKGEIIQAIRDGKFVACKGHDLSIGTVTTDSISVSSSLTSNFQLIADGIVINTISNSLTANFTDINISQYKYLRIKSISTADNNNYALSQPFFIESGSGNGLVKGNANANNIVSNIFIGTQAEYDSLPDKTGILAIIEE